MKKSILIIGGTGFLGKSFFDYINKNKLIGIKLSKIIIVSRRRIKIKTKIKTLFIKKNIKDLKKIPVTDYIIYSANSSNNLENLKGVHNFRNLLDQRHKKTKILFTSSGAVYGESINKKKFNEKNSINLKMISKFKGYKKNYAITKIKMENIFKSLAEDNFKVSIARLFTFIGKRILTNKNFAIADLIEQAKNRRKKIILLSNSREVYRSYMSADDLIRWLIKIVRNSSKYCKIYNVGSDEIISISKLANIIGKKFNKKVVRPKNLSKKKNNNIDFYVPSIIKARSELNLNIKKKIKTSLREIL